jgi:hypothetical protein
MSNFFEDFGIDEKAFNEAEAETVAPAFEVLPSGVYAATIEELATFKSKKGAGMMKATIHITSEDRTIEVYQNLKKLDGSANEIGTRTFKSIIAASGVDMDEISKQAGKIKAYGAETDASIVKGIKGKKIAACVRAVFQEGEKFENTNEIEAFAKPDGTNANGEDIIEAFKARIEKTPVKTKKAKEQSGGNKSTEAKTQSGESVADLL